ERGHGEDARRPHPVQAGAPRPCPGGGGGLRDRSGPAGRRALTSVYNSLRLRAGWGDGTMPVVWVGACRGRGCSRGIERAVHETIGAEAVVMGAGPAGLTAAHELLKQDVPVSVVERDPRYVGGISRTVEHNGFRFDIGGHRFFSKSQEIEDLWTE